MFAEFINQPTSGQFDEKSFDLDNSVWRSPHWCWVKFTTGSGQEWVGAFRGKSLKTSIANKISQVAVLTDYCICILDIDKREVIFSETQTQFRDIVSVPTEDRFLIADYYQVGTLDKDFKFRVIQTDYDMDYITFKSYNGCKLIVELNKMPDNNRVSGYVDTTEWTLTID